MAEIRKTGRTGEPRNTVVPVLPKRVNEARVSRSHLEVRAPLAERAGSTVGELARPLDRLPNRPDEALPKAAGVSGR
jgi:hypothetical protein